MPETIETRLTKILEANGCPREEWQHMFDQDNKLSIAKIKQRISELEVESSEASRKVEDVMTECNSRIMREELRYCMNNVDVLTKRKELHEAILHWCNNNS
jgi:hypothetical protein